MWPWYSKALRSDVDDLLRRGGSLSAYRANPQVGVEPAKGSWAWTVERQIERKFRVRHAVVVNSGTAALHAALAALRLPPGSRVLTTPYSFSATSAAVLLAGYTPQFADVCPYSFNLTPETVKKAITKETKALLPVSLFGGMCDVEGLKQFGLPIVEDASQAVGARNQHGYSGTNATVGTYSFNGCKNAPVGEMGALVTNDSDIALRARLLMNHGENFGQKEVGYNYRPNEVTACIAYHGLLELEERNKRRIALVDELKSTLGSFLAEGEPFFSFLKADKKWLDCRGTSEDGSHVFYVYPFTVHGIDRSLFIKRMAKRGIPVGAGYITPHLAKYPAFLKYRRGPLPVVEELSNKTLCILSTLTPDKPLSYARKVAKAMRESLA